jgi:RNA polymerase sigma-70 factor (ECF subfamily)
MLPDRLEGALRVVYLVFNEGYAATAGDSLVRRELTAEAIRLGRLLKALLPREPEVDGLLALMLLQDSRRAARLDTSGELVTLEEQDRSLWDAAEIAEGVPLAEAALRAGGAGFYAVQAAIAALHAESRTAADTDWPQIAILYTLLLRVHPSPVVALNRAAAVAMAHGPRRGLDLLEELEHGGELAGYHLLSAAKADLLRRLGCRDEAAAAYRQALELVSQGAERRYLERRLAEVS